MIDVEDFLCILVDQSVGHRPADTFDFLVVNRALVLRVVLLGWACQWILPRWINVIGNFALRDAYMIALSFI